MAALGTAVLPVDDVQYAPATYTSVSAPVPLGTAVLAAGDDAPAFVPKRFVRKAGEWVAIQ